MFRKSSIFLALTALFTGGIAFAGTPVVQPSNNSEGGLVLLLVVGALIVAAASGAKGKGKGPSE